MSVVGLTFGKAANASRPTTASAASAATTATTLAGGRSRSYQPKPQASATARRASDAACQLTSAPPVAGSAPPPQPPLPPRPSPPQHRLPSAEHRGQRPGRLARSPPPPAG